MSSDPFAPLSGKPPAAPTIEREAGRSIVVPIPANAPPPPGHRLGKPGATWRYAAATGALLGYVHRFDGDGDKQFRPQTLWRDDAAGVLEWRWESWPAPRPLYGLDLLAAKQSAPVVITEGEKACDAARRLLPAGFVAITSPNGSKSAKKADWSPLTGRRVIIWPDADDAGLAYSQAVASIVAPIAASVRIVSPPEPCAEGWDAADAEADGWGPDRIAALIDGARAAQDDKPDQTTEPGERKRRESRSDALMAALDGLDLWHDADLVAYATIEIAGHAENWALKSQAFKRWLANLSRLKTGQVLSSSTLDDVIRTLEAIAINECPRHIAYLRTGRYREHIYLDLCDDAWRAVEITAHGWRVVERPPVKFIRTPAMRALPEPEAGEGIEIFRDLVNVKDDDSFKLVVAFMVAALRDRGPYPVLVVNGEQGTGKSVFSRMVRGLIDPSAAPIRAAPKDDRDLIVSAMNSKVLAFDNLSSVPNWLSDALCRIATGGGFATRMLHTDRDEVICEVQSPVILNGIPSLTDRADLADRALNVHLRVIPESERRPEDALWQDYHERQSLILGALLDAVSAGLRNVAGLKLDRLPRMADFMKWVSAAESGLGWETGDFVAAYNRNRADVADGAFEADAVAVAIRDFMRASTEQVWTGTATELLSRLAGHASDTIRKSRAWPATASGLGNRLDRAAPLLRVKGFVIDRRKSDARLISIIAPDDMPVSPGRRAALPPHAADDDIAPV
jgi:putative DNA primase/helicase